MDVDLAAFCDCGVEVWITFEAVVGGVSVGSILAGSFAPAVVSATFVVRESLGTSGGSGCVGVSVASVRGAFDGCDEAAPGARGRAEIFGLKAKPPFFLNMELMMMVVIEYSLIIDM